MTTKISIKARSIAGFRNLWERVEALAADLERELHLPATITITVDIRFDDGEEDEDEEDV